MYPRTTQLRPHEVYEMDSPTHRTSPRTRLVITSMPLAVAG